MEDIKRLSAFLIALSMFVTNMTIAVVSADETESSEEVQEAVSDIVEETPEDAEPIAEEIPEQKDETNEEIVRENSDQEVQHEENTGISEQNTGVQKQSSEVVSDVNEVSAVIKGKGDIEGLVNTKVFQVTLPIQGNGLDYVADPQGLIAKTEGEKHPDSHYDPDSNVYFNNGTDGSNITSYSGTSNPLSVVNKSSCAVSVVARVSAYFEQGTENPVAVSGTKDWENVKKPSIYLSVIQSDNGTETVLTQREKVLTASIPGCADAYKYVVEGDDYAYRLKSDEEITAEGISFSDFSLVMTGECNSEGEWDDSVEYDFPSTSVVWNVGFAVSAKPCINTVEYSVAYSSAIEIPYSLGAFDSAASEISSAEYTAPDGSAVQLVGNSSYMNVTDDMITLSSDFAYLAHSNNGGTIKFRFNDPEQTEVDVVLDNNAAPSLDESECTISSSDSSVSFAFDLGVGSKSATKILKITFGNSDFSSSAYSTVSGGTVTLSASAVRAIQMKNGGRVYITFDDPNHTKCGIKVNIE